MRPPPALAGNRFFTSCGMKTAGHCRPFGLVNRHHPDCVRVCVGVVLPAFGVRLLGVMAKEPGKALVFLGRIRMKVDALEVRDRLAELAEVVKHDLAAVIRHFFFAQPDVLEEGHVLSLQVIDLELADLRIAHVLPGSPGGRDCAIGSARIDPEVCCLPGRPAID